MCRLPAIASATTATATASTAATATAAATTVAATAAIVTATATTAVAPATTTVTTAAVATASTTVATTSSTAAEATAAATAATALLALLGFVDAERPTVEGPAIHTLDRLGGFLGGPHGHEREAAGAARFAVGDEVDIRDGSEFLERGADALSIGVERKIANVQTSVHRLLNLAQNK